MNRFISNHIPSGLWEMFLHARDVWAYISFIFQEHEMVVWPVMTTAQLVLVVSTWSHMARVHLQKHLISCQVPEHNFKYNLELLWREGFKFNEFLRSRFLMLKQGDSHYTNKGIIRVIFKIRWPRVQYETLLLRRWGCIFCSVLITALGKCWMEAFVKKPKDRPRAPNFPGLLLKLSFSRI